MMLTLGCVGAGIQTFLYQLYPGISLQHAIIVKVDTYNSYMTKFS